MLQEASGAAGHPSYRRYHYGNGSLLVEDGGTRRFISTDALGSTTDLTGSGGAVASMRKYDAWGQYRNDTAPLASEPKLGFTGHQYDPETGLVYARARYYDAEMGRFISRDVNEGSIANAPSLHRYSYAHGNPTVYVDKDGRSATAVGFVGGFFWGFEQMAQGMVSDIWHGRVRDTSDYLSVWGQNIVAGTEIGASIDVAIASGGIAASSVSGGLGFAGISALTASGEAKDWSKFGDTQVVEGGKGLLAGAALGAVVKAGGVAVQAAARTQAGQAVARVASKTVGAVAETEAGQVIAKAATTAAEKVGGLLRRAGAGADEAVEELLGAGKVAQLPGRAGKALGEAEEKVGDFIVQAWKEARTPWAAPEPMPPGMPRVMPSGAILQGPTEIVHRVMSQAELDATIATGLVRGGRPGTHYVTNAANRDGMRARQRLGLPQTPEIRAKLEVPQGVFSDPTKVEPMFGMPGGGSERTGSGRVLALVVDAEKMR